MTVHNTYNIFFYGISILCCHQVKRSLVLMQRKLCQSLHSIMTKNVFIDLCGMTGFHLSDIYDLAIVMDSFVSLQILPFKTLHVYNEIV